jgi:uncharacterized protein
MSKVLLVVAIVFVVIWFMRGARLSQRREDNPPRRAAPPPPQDMVECPVCRVHLPRSDALAGPGGQVYCCAEHSRRAAG